MSRSKDLIVHGAFVPSHYGCPGHPGRRHADWEGGDMVERWRHTPIDVERALWSTPHALDLTEAG